MAGVTLPAAFLSGTAAQTGGSGVLSALGSIGGGLLGGRRSASSATAQSTNIRSDVVVVAPTVNLGEVLKDLTGPRENGGLGVPLSRFVPAAFQSDATGSSFQEGGTGNILLGLLILGGLSFGAFKLAKKFL